MYAGSGTPIASLARCPAGADYKGKMALTKAGKVLAQQPVALWAVLTNYFCASSITLPTPGLTIAYGATGWCFSTS